MPYIKLLFSILLWLVAVLGFVATIFVGKISGALGGSAADACPFALGTLICAWLAWRVAPGPYEG